MKKIMSLFAIAMLLSPMAFAAMTEGTIASVDAAGKTLEIKTAEGSSSVMFGDATTWPEGVTDPSTLVGKSVKVETDDTTKEATSVMAAM